MENWLRWAGYGLLALDAVPWGVVLFLLIRARRAPFYALRRAALVQAKRWAMAGLVLLVVGVDLLLLPPRIGHLLERRRRPTPTPFTPTATPTATPRPTHTPTATATRRPTATPPFIPTPTPVVPVPESALTPIPSAVPAGPEARITIITLAAGRDEEGQPVDPGTRFPPGRHRVYLFVTYSGMRDGLAWTFAVYHDGELVASDTRLWEWGPEGNASLYYTPPDGYQTGIYEMRVFIEERLQGVAQFEVQ